MPWIRCVRSTLGQLSRMGLSFAASVRNTGSPMARSAMVTGRPRGQVGRLGVAERFAVPRKPGNAGGGKGPQFKTDATSGEGFGDWATYELRKLFRNCRRRCTRKRRQKPAIASTRCTTRSAVTTFWPMRLPSAAPTRGCPEPRAAEKPPSTGLARNRFRRDPRWRESGVPRVSAPFAGFLSVGHFVAHERKFSRHFKRIF
jgi:hypothetical protein